MTVQQKLAVGDHVRLTGQSWDTLQGRIVTVDEFKCGMPWNNTVDGVNSLGSADGYSYADTYAVQLVTADVPALTEVADTIAALKALGFTGKQARAMVVALVTHAK